LSDEEILSWLLALNLERAGAQSNLGEKRRGTNGELDKT
jgi:hypothetical protein